MKYRKENQSGLDLEESIFSVTSSASISLCGDKVCCHRKELQGQAIGKVEGQAILYLYRILD